VIVIAATNIPNSIDPALRRPGRFDRELEIPIPNQTARGKILEIHSRGMPLASGVKLDELAEITHGFVGADLEALCREAAMTCLREVLPSLDLEKAEIPFEVLSKLEVTQNHFLNAMREIQPSAIREVFVELPNVQWSDVGGLQDVKRALKEAVEWPLKYEQLFAQAKLAPPKGILLTGPPGTGKTLIAKAVATEAGVNFISVKGPELFSKFLGESERGVREIFRKAKQAAPCIIFFDEIDSLIPMRSVGSTEQTGERVVGQFLTELDGVTKIKGVLVLAATNRLDRLDAALLRAGRLDQILEIPLPDQDTREEIFHVHTKGKPLASEVSLANLAKKTDGMTGADIEAICREATLCAIRRVVEEVKGKSKSKGLLITRADFEKGLEGQKITKPIRERR
jgi:transitional endoplasmic reticulum ATPase